MVWPKVIRLVVDGQLEALTPEMLEDIEQFLSLTSLTPEEFSELYERVMEYACRMGYRRYSRSAKSNNWGAGRPHKRPLIDRLTMALMVLKGIKIQVVALSFRIKHDTVQAAFDEIMDILKNCIDTPKRVVARLLHQGANASLLEFMPGPDVGLDAMVVGTTRPPRGAIGRAYYRRKKGNGLNLQAIVDTGGYVIDVSKSVPAAAHDIVLFRSHTRKALLRYFRHIFYDPGYTGVGEVPPARMEVAAKRLPNRKLDHYEVVRNEWIGGQRYVVERNNSFIKAYGYTRHRHWYESNKLDDVVQVICGLINFRTVRRKKKPLNWGHGNRELHTPAPNPEVVLEYYYKTTSCQTVFNAMASRHEPPFPMY